MLVEGGCDSVMVYHHARQAIQLDPAHYDMLVLGVERLSPYSARRTRMASPCTGCPARRRKPVPFLSYTANAFLGRMVDLLLADSGEDFKLDKCYETDMAEALKVMALAGHGMAFLPESAVRDEVAQGRLRAEAARAAPLSIEMEIRLYRARPGEVGSSGAAVRHGASGNWSTCGLGQSERGLKRASGAGRRRQPGLAAGAQGVKVMQDLHDGMSNRH